MGVRWGLFGWICFGMVYEITDVPYVSQARALISGPLRGAQGLSQGLFLGASLRASLKAVRIN